MLPRTLPLSGIEGKMASCSKMDQLMPGGCRVETEHSHLMPRWKRACSRSPTTKLFEQQREQRVRPPEPDIALPEVSLDAAAG